jgi:propanol-preferring alcohol dehydrogenase
MSDIPSFPYADLWGERRIQSVANLTREDGHAFMSLAAEFEITPSVTRYPLREANRALDDLRSGSINGSAVLIPDEE